MKPEQPVRGGWEIPLFQYESGRHLLVPEEANRLVAGHNRIHALEIIRGDRDAVFISDSKITIQVKRSSQAEPGAANSFYRGEYSTTKLTTFLSGQDYVVGHMVRVSPSNAAAVAALGAATGAVPGIYICAEDNPTASDIPRHPLQNGGENAHWHWISTWPYQTEVCDENGDPTAFIVDGQEDPDPPT